MMFAVVSFRMRHEAPYVRSSSGKLGWTDIVQRLVAKSWRTPPATRVEPLRTIVCFSARVLFTPRCTDVLRFQKQNPLKLNPALRPSYTSIEVAHFRCNVF